MHEGIGCTGCGTLVPEKQNKNKAKNKTKQNKTQNKQKTNKQTNRQKKKKKTTAKYLTPRNP